MIDLFHFVRYFGAGPIFRTRGHRDILKGKQCLLNVMIMNWCLARYAGSSVAWRYFLSYVPWLVSNLHSVVSQQIMFRGWSAFYVRLIQKNQKKKYEKSRKDQLFTVSLVVIILYFKTT